VVGLGASAQFQIVPEPGPTRLTEQTPGVL